MNNWQTKIVNKIALWESLGIFTKHDIAGMLIVLLATKPALLILVLAYDSLFSSTRPPDSSD